MTVKATPTAHSELRGSHLARLPRSAAEQHQLSAVGSRILLADADVRAATTSSEDLRYER